MTIDRFHIADLSQDFPLRNRISSSASGYTTGAPTKTISTAIREKHLCVIKRIRRVAGGKMLILSDNPAVPPQEVDEHDVHVVGKVVSIARIM
jgi:hypothetical protein